ncbi:MAG: DUF4118 domain-containing protein [Magnetococcales bacterium]|nr:DUF4118 domain-containing protein [Magnetococcales bacterium]
MPAPVAVALASVIALLSAVMLPLTRIRGEFWSVALVGLTTLLLIASQDYLLLANVLMVYLLLVFLVAIKLGRRASILASFLSIAAFAYYFVPPYASFAIINPQYLLILGFMLLIALITTRLTTGLHAQIIVAENRERRILSLYELASELTGVVSTVQIVIPCRRFIKVNFDAQGTILMADAAGKLSPLDLDRGATGLTTNANLDLDLAQGVFDMENIPNQNSMFQQDATAIYIPLRGGTRIHGILVLSQNNANRELSSEQESLLKTCVTFIGVVLERLEYAARTQQATLLAESERLRNALLASLSHDMRTPVAAMAGIADAMQLSSPPLSATHMDLLNTMRRQVRLILSDIDKLLDMADLQTDHVTLHKEWQLLEEVIGSAIKTSALVLEGCEVRINIDDGLPLLEMDAMMMERVFCNLLENAARHTPAGSRIDIDAYVKEGQVIVDVTDNGPGFPPGTEESMFEKFVHGKSRTGMSGVGLGLAVVRAVLQAHNGAIHAENRPEGGVKIEFSLPIHEPPPVDPEVEKFL